MKNFFLFVFTIKNCISCCRGSTRATKPNISYPLIEINSLLPGDIDNIVETIRINNGKRDDSLCDKSIFDNCGNNALVIKDTAVKLIESRINGTKSDVKLNLLEKKAIGCILGMCIGDSRGAPFEFVPVNTILYNTDNYNNIDKIRPKEYNAFSQKKGQWTDDTSMGLCIADSLIVNNGVLVPLDIMKRFLAWWYYGYNNAFRNDKKRNRKSTGLGGNISESFKYFIANPNLERTPDRKGRNSGNGSIMRNAPIPICYFRNLEEALLAAEKQSLITHCGKEAAECCKLLTYIIWQIFNNPNKSLRSILDDIKYFKTEVNSVKGLINSKSNVPSEDDKSKRENWDWKNKNFEYNKERAANNPGYLGAFAMDNMAMSLHILYHTTSFKQAIEVATKLCGDADSVASVVGQIAGAYYSIDNIPSEWIKDIYKWDGGDIVAKGIMLLRLRPVK